MIRRIKESVTISTSLIKIEIIEDSESGRCFKMGLDPGVPKFPRFPKTAKVVLDATCAGSEDVQRFEFGTIKRIVLEQKFYFKDKLAEKGKNIIFTLKIIDTSEEFGRILGIAKITTGSAQKGIPKGKQGILPIIPSDELGEELWRLKFDGNDHVFLLVNNTVDEGLPERFANDITICGLVFPVIVRTILTKALILEQFDPEDSEGGWNTDWTQFAKNFDSNISSDDDEEERGEWIESVVDKFCEQHRFKQEFFKKTIEEKL
jgi:hypothetical protein